MRSRTRDFAPRAAPCPPNSSWPRLMPSLSLLIRYFSFETKVTDSNIYQCYLPVTHIDRMAVSKFEVKAPGAPCLYPWPQAKGAVRRGRRGRSRSSSRGNFPMKEEFRDRGRLHAAHGFEFAGLLAEKKLAALAEDRERRNSFAQRNPVALGDVQILIHASDVDVNQDEIGVEDGSIDRIVKVAVEHMAIRAPIAAEVEDDSLVRRGRLDEGGAQVDFRPVGRRIDVGLARMRRCEGHREQNGQDDGGPGSAGVSHVPGDHTFTAAAFQAQGAISRHSGP